MNTENQNIEFKESWGRGIEKICTLCKNYGIQEPEYTVHPGDIMLKFRAAARIENHTNNIVESIVEKLPTMRGRIVKLVWKNPYASARTISEEVGIAPRNVQEHLRDLQAQGIIRRVGPDKGGHWELLQQS